MKNSNKDTNNALKWLFDSFEMMTQNISRKITQVGTLNQKSVFAVFLAKLMY